jgi:PAS domain S-box-containing protein
MGTKRNVRSTSDGDGRRAGQIREMSPESMVSIPALDGASGGPVPTPNGHGDLLDLAEHRVAEAKLREANAKYRSLVERLPAVTYIEALEASGPTLFISPQIESILGYTPEEWVGDPELWASVIHPEDRDTVLAEVKRTALEGVPFHSEYRMVAKDGRVVWCHEEADLVRDDLGTPLFRQGIMFDVSDIAELRNEGERLSAIMSRDLLYSIAALRNLAVSLDRNWDQLEEGSRRRIVRWMEEETARLRDISDRAVESLQTFRRPLMGNPLDGASPVQ